MNESLSSLCRGLFKAACGVGKAVSQSAEKVGNELQNVTTTVTHCATQVGEGFQNMTTQLSKGPLESDVSEQFGESLANWVLSGKALPSKEDFLNALDTVLPQYQEDMSIITTDVKDRLVRCFECATTKFELTTSDRSPVAHNPTENQLSNTSADETREAIQCGAVLGGIGGGLAAGPGGVLPGATFGAVSGAASKMGSLLLNKIIEEAKKNQIKRESRQTTTTAAS